MTLEALWKEGCETLRAACVEEYELDAKYLLMEAFHLDAAHFLLERRRPLELSGSQEHGILGLGQAGDRTALERPDEVCASAYYRMLERRSNRMPLQYVLGRQEFMGLSFEVNSHVLIPRQDTETLVEEVLNRHPDKGLRILDLCTGSGCIAVSLSVLGGYREVMGTDLSEKALETAVSNALRLMEAEADEVGVAREEEASQAGPYGVRLSARFKSDGLTRRMAFAQGDLLSALRPGVEPFDVIVSNPPYIPSEVISGLMPEVKDYEPREALDGEADGLSFYRRIIAGCKKHIKPGGSVYFEIGYDQGSEVTKLMAEAGFSGIHIVRDAPGLDRVAVAVYDNRI